MLFNTKTQPVTLTNNEIKICIDGKKFQEMKNEGKPINGKMQTTIKMRESILKPFLKENSKPIPMEEDWEQHSHLLPEQDSVTNLNKWAISSDG